MYSLDKSVANALDRALIAEQPLRIEPGSNNTKILRTSITSSNEAAISVNLSSSGLVIAPSRTLVYGVDSTNSNVISGEINDGVLSIVPSENVVTSVVFTNQALNGKIENNVLTIGGSIGASFEEWPTSQNFAVGDYIKYKGVEYSLLKAGTFENPSASILVPINKNINGVDSPNVFYFIAGEVQRASGSRWNSIKSKNGRESYLTGLFTSIENYDGHTNASSVRVSSTEVITSSTYSPYSHVGDYTLLYSAKIFEGAPGAAVLKISKQTNIVRSDLSDVLIKISDNKSNSLDVCGMRVPFHFGLPNLITIRVSGEGRLGGQEFEVRVNNINVVTAQTSSLTEVSNLYGQLVINGEDEITASQITQEISALVGIASPLSDSDLATMYEYLSLDMKFARPTLDLLIKFKYDFISTAVHMFSEVDSALLSSYVPSTPQNGLLSSGLSVDSTNLFSVATSLPTLDEQSSRLILSNNSPMITGLFPTKHLTLPLTIKISAKTFSENGSFILCRLNASEDGVDELIIIYENTSGKISVINNSSVVYGINVGLAGLVGDLVVYVSLKVVYVEGKEHIYVFVRANGDEVCSGELTRYETAQQFQHIQIGGSAPNITSIGTFMPNELWVFDEALSTEDCV